MRRRSLLKKSNDVVNPNYLTFTANSACQVKFTGKTPSGGSLNTLQYSLDGGKTWTTLPNNTYLSLASGNSIMFKGSCIPLNSSSSGGIGAFASTGGTFNASGNVMSLLFGDNAEGQTNLTGYNYVFMNLFSSCKGVVSVENLILPATTLVSYCYHFMFYGCTGLTTVPSDLLPATTLASNCYNQMFRNCSSLNYIKAMFTTRPTTSYTSNWVNGVASSGTFVKNSAATWNVTGVNGIPSGWTVQTASS